MRAASLARAEAMARRVTISRDAFGVPHVHGETDAAAVFGGLYARAEDEMARIESAYAGLLGRGALLHGPEKETLDRLALAFELPERAQAALPQVTPEVRALLEAGADALNFFLHRHPRYEARAIPLWEPWMLLAYDYSWSWQLAQQEVTRIVTGKKPPTGPDGSNAWALAPSRTASGGALLYINPHMPLDEPYELHLRSDTGLNVSGTVAYGAGLLPMAGFNDKLGWALTVNQPDLVDAYEVELGLPGQPLGYRFGQETRQAVLFKRSVSVRTEKGVEQREVTLLKTHHGPVVKQQGRKVIALRAAGLAEPPRALEQWLRMGRARSLEEWREAVAIQGVVFHNLVYADARGNIGYLYNGRVPVRDESFDWKGTLDGSDPRTEWQGYHPLSALPQVWNPPCGYVQNCNSPPFATAAKGENPTPEQFPRSMVGGDATDGRVAMSHQFLAAAKAWTLDDLEHAAFDSTVHTLETLRRPLLADVDQWKKTSPADAARIADAVELLRTWDGRITSDSIAATVFIHWVEKTYSPAWRERRAAGDLSAALAAVLVDLETTHRTWRVPWGEIQRHQRFDKNARLHPSDKRPSLPITGAVGSLGVSFCYLSRQAEGQTHRYGYHGHSYVAAIEFTAAPTARSIVPFGTSRDPRSPHYEDQAALYTAGRLKPAPLSPAAVEAAARRTYRPGE